MEVVYERQTVKHEQRRSMMSPTTWKQLKTRFNRRKYVQMVKFSRK
jgi:hypothetical protein